MVLIPIIVFYLYEVESKLDMLKEEKEKISSRLDLVLNGQDGKY